jgi:VWFA-related protein
MARLELGSRRTHDLLLFPPAPFRYFALGFLLGILPSAYGQSGRARPANQPDQPIRLRAEEVLVPVNVQSDLGKLPDHLSPSDLIVAEDNTRRTITALMRTPANIVLILDNCIEFSGSKQVNLNRDSALNIIESMGDTDKAAILAYADKVDVLSGWTGDKAVLRLALTEKFKPGAKSHLYDSLIYAAEELLPKASGRHSVVLFTDGYDDFPKSALDQARQALDRARATVYVVDQSPMILAQLKPHSSKDRFNVMKINPRFRQMVENQQRYMGIIEAEQKTMKDLAESSGGAFWDPANADEFKPASRSLISEMGSEYMVAYTSERPREDTALHDLKVYPNRLGLKVRVRRGVYSSP